MVEHENALNFCRDGRTGFNTARTRQWLAVTSPSLIISVLELFWTLPRGFQGRDLCGDEGQESFSSVQAGWLPRRPMEIQSLLLFIGIKASAPGGAYRLLLRRTVCGQTSTGLFVWLCGLRNRHFHEFGGLYPNPR